MTQTVERAPVKHTSRIAELLLAKLAYDVPEWMSEGSCVDRLAVDFFFDEHRSEALRICSTCPVKLDCDDYAEERNVNSGVWGAAPRGSDA